MRILLITIYGHDRPLPVRTLHRVSRYQRMTRTVIDVSLRGEHLVLSRSWLHPFEIDQLRDEELRERLLNLVVDIDSKHAKRSGRIVAAVFHL